MARLYSIGEMLVTSPKGGVMRAEGVVFWEIAKQTQEGYHVRLHGHKRATRFVSMDKVGDLYFHEPAEIMKFIRKRLRESIAASKENTRILEKEYAEAKKGLVYTKEWCPRSFYTIADRVPKRLPKAGASDGQEGGGTHAG